MLQADHDKGARCGDVTGPRLRGYSDSEQGKPGAQAKRPWRTMHGGRAAATGARRHHQGDPAVDSIQPWAQTSLHFNNSWMLW